MIELTLTFITPLPISPFFLLNREMALEGLFLGKDVGRIISQNLDHRYPKLGDMLEYILKQQPRLLDSYEMREQKLLFPSKMYVAMIKFLLKCFESELVQNNSLGRSSEFLASVERMCLLLEHAMAFEGSVELHSTTSKALVTIGSYLPEVSAACFLNLVALLLVLHLSLAWLLVLFGFCLASQLYILC